MDKEKETKVTVMADRVIKVEAIREINPCYAYIVTINIPKGTKEPERIALINKTELAFKTFGIKNIKIIEAVAAIYQILS